MRSIIVILVSLGTVKEIGCSEKGCTEILRVASPDDEHVEVSLQPIDGLTIKREYKSPQNHVTTIYWRPKTTREYGRWDFVSDFTPLFLLLILPSAILGILLPSIKLDPTQSATTFETIVFFVFLLTILGFLYAMKWLLAEQTYDEALGLPQGSIRTVIALSVIFFVLLVGIFKLTLPGEIVTLLTALVAFYFGASSAKSTKGEEEKPPSEQTQPSTEG